VGARYLRRLGCVLLVATVIGCSGSGSTSLTKQQIVGRANAICAKANRSIAGMYRPDPDDSAATAIALEKVTARQRTALRGLRALVPPDEDASDYRRWLTQIDLALDQADASRRAIAGSDVVAAGEANRRGEQIRVDADRFATSYGMETCAQPG
jgi:hypothetical protein